MIDAFLDRCLLLDLEASRPAAGQAARIYRVGAVLGAETLDRKGLFDAGKALAELGRLAERADHVLGHNLVDHDLKVLEALAPSHPVLDMPVVDTLYLSPLAFPENPYHHLVKDYKLIRQTRNDPVEDARLAARLFRDQWASFGRMEPDRLALYAFCLGAGKARGTAELLSRIADRPPMTTGEALDHLARYAQDETVCRTALGEATRRDLALPGRRPAWAYAVAWLDVAGGNSVLPPWVRHRHPEIHELLDHLRERPCDAPGCRYCRRHHDPENHLRRFFGFESFRPRPEAPGGGSLQREVVRCGLAGRPLLAILATGAGKSICYQLPALARYFRRGLLTVVISPLQALMKDQIDNLNAVTVTDSAAALYGLLTPPERGAVLERVRLGDVALLYVAPEQLRNRSFEKVVEQREIACWVFDEAHCLSKWGHDFRPDYLYAARFIRDLAQRQNAPVPPVACFTATAKDDVSREIREHFRDLLGQELELFTSAVERDELSFHVEPVVSAEKLGRVHDLLADHLADPDTGSAVVYFASRRATVQAADYLSRRGLQALPFHAGLKTPVKRETLDAFLTGEVRVVCATNAFGMGIDKNDVHLVIHADIPGSLESYLQEAGRAGRDRRVSDCVLLFDPEDVEKQFRLAAGSQLRRRDLAQILRALRRARAAQSQAAQARTARPRGGAAPDDDTKDLLAMTSGELLRDDELETSFARDDWQADTKVKTAVSWLERAGFLERLHNQTRVFQGRLNVSSLAEAQERLDRLAPRLRLPLRERRRWLAILKALLNADPDQGLTADELAELPDVTWDATGEPGEETPAQKVLRVLHSMTETGFLDSGLRLTAWLRPRGPHNAFAVYEVLCRLDRAFLDLLAENAPDADPEQWLDLSLRLLNQRLVDEGHRSTPAVLRKLLSSLSEDGKGLAARDGSLELSFRSRDRYRVRVKRPWPALRELAERRRALGKVILDALARRALDAPVPGDGAPGDNPAAGAPRPQVTGKVLVEFGLEDLTTALHDDLALRGRIRDPLAAAERGLLFLHEQKVLQLQNGLAVFRQAMTLRVRPEARGRRYTRGDYQPLAQHYGERTFQIHVMARYADLGLDKIRSALHLVRDYFHLGKDRFVDRYFADDQEILERAVSREAYHRIVDGLANPRQIALVAAPPGRNLLILAGPGSGKTRVVVHRCAYLLRVERVPARRVLVLCFNRHAALDVRRRLYDLVGREARRVTVQTYHGLAMRLTGTSFATLASRSDSDGGPGRSGSEGEPEGGRARHEPDFGSLISDSVELLTGDGDLPGLESGDLREQLLAGYSHILVDEYQDINREQYQLVAALAGRGEVEAESRLTILAVGDDDQNIYSWNGADVEFIRRFREDYRAEVHHLVENYRSSAHIVACAERLISANADRMKIGRPIVVNESRRRDPPGGRWASIDQESGGRVQLLRVDDDATQAAAIVDRMFHMKRLDPEFRWADCAVLARRHAVLEPVRAVLEEKGIPQVWAAGRDGLPPLHHIREVAAALELLEEHRRDILSASGIVKLLAIQGDPADPWTALVVRLVSEWRDETSNAKLPVQNAIEFLYESLVELRRGPGSGGVGVPWNGAETPEPGVHLATVHAAKGLEFRHVFLADGHWPGVETGCDRRATEDERRLYYVGMTRARETLHLLSRRDEVNQLLEGLGGDFLETREPVVEAPPEDVVRRRFALLGLQDLFLSFAGRKPPEAPIHRYLAALKPGHRLGLRRDGRFVELVDQLGRVVGALSDAGRKRWASKLDKIEVVRVVALVVRRARDSDANYRARLLSNDWEIPISEITYHS